MSLVETFHAEHKARLMRLGAPPRFQASVLKPLIVVAAPQKKEPWFEIISEKAAPGSQTKIDDVLRVCCKYFDLTSSQIKSARRTAPVVYARQVAMYLCKFHTIKSYPEIGRRLGGRDHTTVMHGYRKIEANLLKDWKLAFDVAHVEAML
jgi:chromosomal replication initiation ATPase DnaA